MVQFYNTKLFTKFILVFLIYIFLKLRNDYLNVDTLQTVHEYSCVCIAANNYVFK